MSSIIIENEKIGRIKSILLTEKNPNTCKAIVDSLPIELHSARWGDCLYSVIPVNIDAENTQIDCELGDIGYWIEGKAFVIFFGKTPHSTDDNPKAASAINIFAKIEGDISVFEQFDTFYATIIKGD